MVNHIGQELTVVVTWNNDTEFYTSLRRGILPVGRLYVQPDFYYEPRIWVFCDGTPHDRPDIKESDEAKRQSIMARGDEVWVYYYQDDLASIVAARPDIFRKVR